MKWQELVDKYGEPKATEIVIKELRWFADKIESGKMPHIFDCEVMEPDKGALLFDITVTLSMPWPG